MRVNRKYMLIGVAVIGILIIFTFRYVNTIISKEWDDKQQAVQTAYKLTMMAQADSIEPFTGDRPYQIVHGVDKLGQRMIVWVSEADVHANYENEGVSNEDIRNKLRQMDAEVEILRVTPGKINNDYAWEAYYKRVENEEDEYYFGYYRFSDGAHLDTYNLTFH